MARTNDTDKPVEQIAAIADPNLPPATISLQRHEEDKRQRAARRRANLRDQVKCLEPSYAAQVVNSRPKREYKVSCVISARTEGGGRTQKELEGVVIAENEKDAWASFCDRNRVWPSPAMSEARVVAVA